MSANLEQLAGPNPPADLMQLLTRAEKINTTISGLNADKAINPAEIREKINIEEIEKARIAWEIINARELYGSLVTVTMLRLPGEILHSESLNDVKVTIEDETASYGATKTKLKFLRITAENAEGFSAEEITELLLKPDHFQIGPPDVQARRLFNEARAAERHWKSAAPEVRPYYENIRNLVLQNAINGRKTFPALRDYIRADTFVGKAEDMICYRFEDPRYPTPQGNMVAVPWTRERDQAIIESGGYIR